MLLVGTNHLFLHASVPEQSQAKQWPVFIKIPVFFSRNGDIASFMKYALFEPVAFQTLTFQVKGLV